MENLPNCPKCNSEYTYEDGNLLVCPECAYEWTPSTETEEENVIKDSNGNILKDGDTITVIKDLKVKGSSSVVKRGTRVKNIRLVEGDHDIDCKIDGIGAMSLKSCFVNIMCIAFCDAFFFFLIYFEKVYDKITNLF